MAPFRVLSYFARHRTAANLLLVLLVLAGVAAAPNMRAQFFPDVVMESMTVTVRWEGAGAEDVDRGIIQLLDPALLAVEGVDETESVARQGSARIDIGFEPGWDMARAQDEVQAAVDAVTGLPEDADEPNVERDVWWDRVTDVVISGPVGVDQLGRFADEFSTRLFAEGVTRTTIRGVSAPRTIVEVPTISLIQHDVTMREIADAIAEEAEADPAGDLSGASRVRTGTERRSAESIDAITLRTNDDGSKLTIGDVARIHTEGIDRERAYFVGDDPAISIRVDRSAQGDAIEIQRIVEEVAADLEAELPAGSSIELVRTRAEAITSRLDILFDNGLMGLGLVVLLLFLFLNARTAFWVAAGIPVAMLATIGMMYLGGLTINMVSLFALIITLGIVVDDAIVVGEHADFRARRLGEDPMTAAERAATRMFTPVFSATVTTIIAFFGLVAIGGRFGDLIADIPFTVIAVLIASLIECFLILPNHMAHSIGHTVREHWYDWPSRQVNRGFVWVRERLFRPFIAGVVALRYPVVAGALVILASQVSLVIAGDVPWRFYNAPERGSVTGNFAMLPGATREDTLEQMRLLQQSVETLGAEYEAEYGVNPVASALSQVGGTSGRGLSSQDTKDGDQLGAVAVELIDPDQRPFSAFEFIGRLQDEVQRHPMVEEISFRGWRSGPGGDNLDVEIFGADAATLKAAAEYLKAEMSQFPEVTALQDTLAYDKDELILDLTPQGYALGVTVDGLGRVLRDRLSGIEAATYPDGTRSVAIRVELPPEEITADFLERTQIRTEAGAYVPLADIVLVRTESGFSSVRRENGVRVVSVTGDISEDDADRAADISAAMEEEILPALEERFGVATQLSGLSEQEDEFLSDAMRGLVLCLAGIYLTLAWVFSSWSRPVVVMAIIPFGLVGAVWGHHVWDVPLSMFSVVGLIGMVGIIINDSIVLITTIDDYAEERGLVPAILDGAADRLRPVLLTTLTTVLGLTPLLYETSTQAQFLKPTVITLTYGLAFGLVLVLLVVPSLVAIQRDVSASTRSFRRSLRAHGGPARAMRSATGLVALSFFATIGLHVLAGPLGVALPPLLSTLPGAVFAFVGLSAAITFATWIVIALRSRRHDGNTA